MIAPLFWGLAGGGGSKGVTAERGLSLERSDLLSVCLLLTFLT